MYVCMYVRMYFFAFGSTSKRNRTSISEKAGGHDNDEHSTDRMFSQIENRYTTTRNRNQQRQ